MSIAEILSEIQPFGVRHVLVTGGEPLLQRNTPELVRALREAGYLVSIETHGEVGIDRVASDARIIMDIKTPSSGMSRGGFEQNFTYLKKSDEIKFVIASREDFVWACNWVKSGKLPACEILFSPVFPDPGKTYPGVDPVWLAEEILREKIQVRFQLQLHKTLWGPGRQGV